jgi:hypothetical protein
MKSPRPRPGKIKLVKRIFIDGHDYEWGQGSDLSSQRKEEISIPPLEAVEEPHPRNQNDNESNS